LAAQLGLEVPAAPDEPVATPADEYVESEENVDGTSVPAAQPEEPGTTLALPPETELGSFGAGIERLAEAVEHAPVVAEPESAVDEESSAEIDEKRPRKRRKKRRRKGRRPEDSGGQPTEEESEAQADETAAAEVEMDRAPAAEGALDEAQTGRGAEEFDEDESGRLDLFPGDEKETEAAAAPAETGPAEADTVEAAGRDRSGTATEEPHKKKKKRDKSGHRAIPTWDEAIELIVSKNLESRSKIPSDASTRPRPKHKHGRRRGGDRNG
jgi:ribonuclease E